MVEHVLEHVARLRRERLERHTHEHREDHERGARPVAGPVHPGDEPDRDGQEHQRAEEAHGVGNQVPAAEQRSQAPRDGRCNGDPGV